MTNLANQTPAQIDTELERLYLAEQLADQAVTIAEVGLHYALGERKRHLTRNHSTWPTTTEQALTAIRALLVDDTRPYHVQVAYPDLAAKVTVYEAAEAARLAFADEQAPLHAEYARRPWSRFFTCRANGGHVHSSMSCSTCNRGLVATQFGWTPTLSGLTEAEAVAQLGDYSASLCTVCFPTAPVEWTCGKAKTDGCPGGGEAPVKDGRTWSNYQGFHATCTGCGNLERVNQDGTIRRHKLPKAKPTKTG